MIAFCYLILLLYPHLIHSDEIDFNQADVELTTTVAPGKRDCFFQFAKISQTLQFEFRVLDATFGEFDAKKELRINFDVLSPMGRIVLSEKRKMDGIFKHDVKEDGDYEICLDNSFSCLSSKTVYFEVFVDVPVDKHLWSNLNMIDSDKFRNDSLYYFKGVVNKIKDDLNKVEHFQDTFRAVEARDINIQEKNFTKVNTFSSLTTVAMMLFGAFYLYVLKSMLMENSRLYRFIRIF